MLYLVHRVTISIKLRPIKLEQAVSESLPHKGLYTGRASWGPINMSGSSSSFDPRARNVQEINITNCDVTTWSRVNLVYPRPQPLPEERPGTHYLRMCVILRDS